MGDVFFEKEKCDRCGEKLTSRILSWFNLDVLCMSCYKKEQQLKQDLRKNGEDVEALEGCGYIPQVPNKSN